MPNTFGDKNSAKWSVWGGLTSLSVKVVVLASTCEDPRGRDPAPQLQLELPVEGSHQNASGFATNMSIELMK
jgi:hypothetical protein